jgi:hypothetical protein|tara:strand:+ start:140 stop:853 length:714 start_codon:yes stop_codon:yes gene_type:complete
MTSKIEKRIWSLLTLVSEQQVTETLGEIRLRRQDIHRKLLDTSMYAAIIRFVCYGRDMSELSIVIDRVAGNSAKLDENETTTTMFEMEESEESHESNHNDDREMQPGQQSVPFVAASRRNTIIGRYRHGAQSTKTKNKKKKKSGITRSNQIKVRDALRGRSGGELRKLMRQSDQRGIVGEFEMTLNDVRQSIKKKEKGGRGIVMEEPSHITRKMVKSIKSPELKRRLLRHVKPNYYD